MTPQTPRVKRVFDLLDAARRDNANPAELLPEIDVVLRSLMTSDRNMPDLRFACDLQYVVMETKFPDAIHADLIELFRSTLFCELHTMRPPAVSHVTALRLPHVFCVEHYWICETLTLRALIAVMSTWRRSEIMNTVIADEESGHFLAFLANRVNDEDEPEWHRHEFLLMLAEIGMPLKLFHDIVVASAHLYKEGKVSDTWLRTVIDVWGYVHWPKNTERTVYRNAGVHFDHRFIAIDNRPEMWAHFIDMTDRGVVNFDILADNNNIHRLLHVWPKYQLMRAHRVLALMVMSNEGEFFTRLTAPKIPTDVLLKHRLRQKANGAIRYFAIAAALPLELQMILALRTMELRGETMGRLEDTAARWALGLWKRPPLVALDKK